jgi:hypothetical protein
MESKNGLNGPVQSAVHFSIRFFPRRTTIKPLPHFEPNLVQINRLDVRVYFIDFLSEELSGLSVKFRMCPARED